MLAKHPFNYEKSKMVYEACKSDIEAKECYTNVFQTIRRFSEEFNRGEFKVAYGYIKILPDSVLYARHCFIVDAEGGAIDPTLLTLNHFNAKTDWEHHSFYVFDSVDTYIEKVIANDNTPDLVKPLRKTEQKIIQRAFNEGMVIIG